MLDRIMGVVTLKAPTYREIAHDKSATTTAAIIVVVMAIFSAVVGAVVLAMVGSMLSPDQAAQAGTPLGTAVKTFVNQIVSWLVGSWVIAFVAKTFFGGKTDTGEMLRVFGFTQVFGVLGIIPCIGGLIGLVLSIIGAIIGIREAAEFDTTKAVLTGLVAFIIIFIVSAIIGIVLALVGLA